MTTNRAYQGMWNFPSQATGGELSTWAASGLYTGDHGIWLFAEERSSVTANNEAGGRRGAGGHLTSCSCNVNGINEPVKKGGELLSHWRELQADVNTTPPTPPNPKRRV